MAKMSPDILTAYTLKYDVKPLTMNEIRGMNWKPYSEKIDEYRDTFAWLAKAVHKMPIMAAIDVIVQDTFSGTKPRDTCAIAPAVKAAIDGLVVAGVIRDDSPTYVRTVTYLPPVRGKANSFELQIYEALS